MDDDDARLIEAYERGFAAGLRFQGEPVRSEHAPKSIDILRLSRRPSSVLKRYNIKTIGDLLQCSESTLLEMRNFGESALAEVNEKLKALGLKLA